MYAVSANEMRYAVNGVDRMRWQAGGLPTQTYNVATGLWEDLEPVGVVGPNLLDNSNFQIHQRGASGSLANGQYRLDRYFNAISHDGATTYAQPPSGEGTTITTTGATNTGTFNTLFGTKILQRQYNLIRGKNAQMSARVTSNADCNVFFRLVTYKAGTTSIVQLSDPLPVLANVDTEVSFTFPIADVGDLSSDPADRIDVQFFTDNLNEVTTFHWVKLEEGNVFTGYEPTPYAIDEAECMKWFYQISSTDNSSGSIATGMKQTTTLGEFIIPLPVKMYFQPSASASNALAFQMKVGVAFANTTAVTSVASPSRSTLHLIFTGGASASAGDAVRLSFLSTYGTGSWIRASCEL